jgi:hypothetical protein
VGTTPTGGKKMATTTHTTTTPAKVAVGVLSEAVVPGGSNLIKGDLSQGALHLILGIAAGLAFGPWGLLAVKANSLAKSQTGQGVLDQVTG